jgi:hypothetical protein
MILMSFGLASAVSIADSSGDFGVISDYLYLGHGGDIGDFTYGVGFTGYYFPGELDDIYSEIKEELIT